VGFETFPALVLERKSEIWIHWLVGWTASDSGLICARYTKLRSKLKGYEGRRRKRSTVAESIESPTCQFVISIPALDLRSISTDFRNDSLKVQTHSIGFSFYLEDEFHDSRSQ
jgi:hypothetical protein